MGERQERHNICYSNALLSSPRSKRILVPYEELAADPEKAKWWAMTHRNFPSSRFTIPDNNPYENAKKLFEFAGNGVC